MIALLESTARLSAPLVLASVGGVVSERAGVAQLGLEGFILVGAYAAVAAGGGVIGLATAVAVSAMAALGQALLVEKARTSAILAGVGFNLLATGTTTFLLRSHSAPLRTDNLLAGEVFVAIGVAVLAAVSVMLRLSPLGLRMRACGEDPLAAAAAGIHVARLRIAAVAFSGLAGGCAGASLSLVGLGEFSENMANGRGYLAVVAVLLGRWRPLGAAAAALVFGFGDALQLWLRTEGTGIPADLQELLPYCAALIALGIRRGASGEPKSLARDGA